MTSTVSAMFDRYSDAKAAINRLEAAGIPHDNISIVSNDAEHRQHHGTDDATGTGAGTGASLGTLIGGGAGLLAGLGLLAIPGLGPVVAAGWLASTALGAGVGAATGGLVGALTGAGVDEADANVYAEGVRRGGTLVTVRAEDSMAAQAADILDDHGTIDIDERQSSWRNEGWSGTYNPDDTTGTRTTGTSTGMGAAGMGAAGLGSSPMGAGTLRDDDSAIAGTTDSDMDERRRRTRIHGSNPGL